MCREIVLSLPARIHVGPYDERRCVVGTERVPHRLGNELVGRVGAVPERKRCRANRSGRSEERAAGAMAVGDSVGDDDEALAGLERDVGLGEGLRFEQPCQRAGHQVGQCVGD